MSNRRKVRTRPLPFGPTVHLTDDDGQVTDELRLSFPPHLVTPELRRLVLADPEKAMDAYLAMLGFTRDELRQYATSQGWRQP